MKRMYVAAMAAAPVAVLGLDVAVVAPSVASAASSAPASSSSSSGSTNGSVHLVLSAPRSIDRQHSAGVVCKTADGTYTASVHATVRGIPVRTTVTVPSYDGAGSYTTSSVSLNAAGWQLIHSPKAPAVITSTGGSYTFDTKTPRGIHVAGSVDWTCAN